MRDEDVPFPSTFSAIQSLPVGCPPFGPAVGRGRSRRTGFSSQFFNFLGNIWRTIPSSLHFIFQEKEPLRKGLPPILCHLSARRPHRVRPPRPRGSGVQVGRESAELQRLPGAESVQREFATSRIFAADPCVARALAGKFGPSDVRSWRGPKR